MSKHVLISAMILSLSGCSLVPDELFRPFEKTDAQPAPAEPEAVLVDDVETEEIPVDARTVEDFDTTTESDRQAALEAAEDQTGEVALGSTIASLGDATSPGIWLKTPLVDEPGQGRVYFPDRDTSVAVELIPLDAEPGSGSRISLAAMRLLEANLTGLPELEVFLSP